MPRTKLRFSDGHHAGDRARKDQLASKRAAKRAAKAAALREEVGDIEEDVVPYEHKGGEVGETIRLKRMNPSSVSGDAAQPAPQLPLPVASPPPQPPAPPPEPLSDIAAAEAAVARLPPFERNKFIAKRVAEALPPGKLSLPIGGRKKQAVLLVPANVDSPVDQKCLVAKRVGDELKVPQQPPAETEPSPESMSGQESRVVMEKFKFTSRVSKAKMKFFICLIQGCTQALHACRAGFNVAACTDSCLHACNTRADWQKWKFFNSYFHLYFSTRIYSADKCTC